jgi:hypothetical protein
VEEFLQSAVKYEPSLGEKAKKGHHRHIWRKLEWHVLKEDKIEKLKQKIEGHMRIVDTLINRLILWVHQDVTIWLGVLTVNRDVVITTKEKLPEQLKEALNDGLSDALFNHLQYNLNPLRTDILANGELQKALHDNTTATLSEHYNGLSSDIQVLKEKLVSDIQVLKEEAENSALARRRIQACFTATRRPARIRSPMSSDSRQDKYGSKAKNGRRRAIPNRSNDGNPEPADSSNRSIPDSGGTLRPSSNPETTDKESISEV